jgi:hypothetical protein
MKNMEWNEIPTTRMTLKAQGSRSAAKPVKPEVKNSAGSLAAELIFSVILIAAICALPTIIFFASNVGKGITFKDMGTSMWIYMGISAVVFAILRIFLRKPYFASTLVAFAAFLAVNFTWLVSLFRLFFNTFLYAAIGGLVLFILLVAGFFFLLRLLYKKKLPVYIVTRILSVTFAGLVLFNVVTAFIATPGKTKSDDTQVAAIATVAPVYSAVPKPSPTAKTSSGEATPAASTAASFGRPNVYYFILDEYGTFGLTSKYYQYDNKVFYDFLNMNGFNISKESYASDNQTYWCISDYLNLDHISLKLSKSGCIKACANAPLFKAFSDLGYSQFQISSYNGIFNGIVSLDSKTGQGALEALTLDGDDAEDAVSGNSISGALDELLGNQQAGDTKVDTAALNKWGFYPSDYIRDTKEYKNNYNYKDANNILMVFDYLEDASHYSPTAPRVTYTYIKSPHVYFLFNEYGGIIPASQRVNWEDTNIYLGQLKFTTKRLMASLSTIINNDPNSIIILMSDHGIRYHKDCKKRLPFEMTDKDACRILNAVYIKGQKYEIEGLSGINTLRYILNLYGETEFPPINDPVTSASPDKLTGIISTHK